MPGRRNRRGGGFGAIAACAFDLFHNGCGIGQRRADCHRDKCRTGCSCKSCYECLERFSIGEHELHAFTGSGGNLHSRSYLQSGNCGTTDLNLTLTCSAVAASEQAGLSGMGFDFAAALSGSSSQTVSSGQAASFTLVLTTMNPQVTDDLTPASLSKKWMSEVLRKKIGYRGGRNAPPPFARSQPDP